MFSKSKTLERRDASRQLEPHPVEPVRVVDIDHRPGDLCLDVRSQRMQALLVLSLKSRRDPCLAVADLRSPSVVREDFRLLLQCQNGIASSSSTSTSSPGFVFGISAAFVGFLFFMAWPSERIPDIVIRSEKLMY